MKRRFFIKCLALLVVLLATTVGAHEKSEQKAKSIVGIVTQVIDGDTIWVSDGHGRHKVRLNHIDAPESNQPFGSESTAHLKSIITNRTVRIEYEKSDRYGRILGVVFLGETDVNLQMVCEGFAWHYRHFDKTPSYSVAESEARAAKRGLWAAPDPINPHKWRKKIKKQHGARPCRQGLPPVYRAI